MLVSVIQFSNDNVSIYLITSAYFILCMNVIMSERTNDICRFWTGQFHHTYWSLAGTILLHPVGFCWVFFDGWVAFHRFDAQQLHSLIICWWASGSFPSVDSLACFCNWLVLEVNVLCGQPWPTQHGLPGDFLLPPLKIPHLRKPCLCTCPLV